MLRAVKRLAMAMESHVRSAERFESGYEDSESLGRGTTTGQAGSGHGKLGLIFASRGDQDNIPCWPQFEAVDQLQTTRSRCSVSPGVTKRRILGWREWVSLPRLGISAIKAKLDTGAKTSALHAWDISLRAVDGQQWIRFRVHPMQQDKATSVVCEAPVSDQRWVTNSSGTRERRYIISTDLQIGRSRWPIELSLTNREAMEYPMILGREAMRDRLIVDPRASFRATRKQKVVVDGPFEDGNGPKAGGVVD